MMIRRRTPKEIDQVVESVRKAHPVEFTRLMRALRREWGDVLMQRRDK